MKYYLGVEEIEPEHWLAWVFDMPGCFSRARSQSAVIAEAPEAIADYLDWLEGYSYSGQRDVSNMEVEVAETFDWFVTGNDYRVNAFFEDDRRLLTSDDSYHAAWLLECSRKDLMSVVQPLTAKQLNRPIEGEVRHSIRGVLMHIAGAEHWYFESLHLAFDRSEMPSDVFRSLSKVRAQTVDLLDDLVGNAAIGERKGELWSARKIVRRALWHERAHTRQILRYLKNG
jgi:predicted RNase H-like HicB family nuclease